MASIFAAAGEGRAYAVPTRTVIVFDDSGSMRQNDPGRLSAAAAKLYLELARPGDEVALVAFGDSAKLLVPLGHPKDRGAIERALESVRFSQRTTNIGAGLEAAQLALGAETPVGRRDLVLLITDGKVDLGTSRSGEVAAERERIAGPLVDALHAHGAPVYTIAFTDNADRDLLERVAAKSGGSYRYIADAGALHRAFTELFVLAGDAESLPIEGGKLTIDESIGAASLVLSKHGPKDVNTLSAPDESVVSATSHTPGVEWTSAASHDVVRFDKPQAGPWGIHQPPGAEGAVAIVEQSDVSFVVRVGPTPSTIDDRVHLEAELLEQDQRIVAFTRLKEMIVKAVITDPEGQVREVELERSPKDPGLFVVEVESHSPGEHRVALSVTSPTLHRERRSAYRVLPSCFSASVDEHQGLVLRVKGGDLCPRYSAISAKALKKVDNRGPEQLALVPNAHGGFEASVPPLSAGEKGDVVVELDGRTSDGYPVHYSLPPLPLPATVKKSFAERLGRGLMVADGPVFFLLAMAFLALWRKKRAAPASPVTAQPPPPVVVAPVVEAPVVEAPVVEAPVAEATSPEESSSPKLVLLTTDDLDLIDPPGPSSSIADKLKAELASVRAELTKMMESSKQHAESLENVLLKQAEVATLVGGLGGPEGLPASVKPRAELVTAGMRAMDDLLIEGSDRGIALDSGLRALDARLAGIEGGVADPPQRRADIERINLVLVEKSEGQSAEELARLKARALVVKESVAAQAELSKAVEALTSERQALAAEKEAIANRLDQVTTEYNKLFAERAADARPSD